ncbi:hypothetical protein N431DRAFT_472963 [Stipitochalara longipes BDJ]|nr:hypothetical protein N431DRAFT_472963 [Stipitochalara longipes BDJ]
MASSENLYSMEITEDRINWKIKDPKMPKKARMERCLEIPEVLNVKRPLTEEEEKTSGYVPLFNQPPSYLQSKAGKKDVDIEFCNYISPKQVYDNGFWPLMCRAQEICVKPAMISYFEKQEVSLTQHQKKRGTCYDTGVTVQPGHQPNGMQLGKAARGEGQCAVLLQELNTIFAKLHTAALEMSGFKVDNRKHWVVNASVTFGHHDSIDQTSSQINYSAAGKIIESTLKKKSLPHTDGNDDPSRPTVLLNLNNLPANIYPGIFIMANIKGYVPGEQFGIFVMTGRVPHGSKGLGEYEAGFDISSMDTSNRAPAEAYPKLPENYFEGRITVPIYARLDNIRAIAKQTNAEILSDKAITALGTKQNLQELRMRTHIRDNLEKLKAAATSIDDLLEMFSWLDDEGHKQLPRRWIAEMGIEFGGKKVQEYEERYQAALYSGVGRFIPDAESTKPKKTKRKVVFLEDGTKMVKVRCNAITKTKKTKCAHRYWPDPGCTACKVHRVKGPEVVHDGQDEATEDH